MAEVDGVRALRSADNWRDRCQNLLGKAEQCAASGDQSDRCYFCDFVIGYLMGMFPPQSANAANSQSTSGPSKERQKQNNESHS
jgi:hypothetical protein